MCFQVQSIDVLWYSGSLLDPVCGVHTAMDHAAPRATRPWREQMNALCECDSSGEREGERERASFPPSDSISLDIDGPGAL